MGDTEQPQSISTEQLRLLNTQYFHTLRSSLESQITGAAGRILKKAEARIAKLEDRIAELETEVARLRIEDATHE